MKNINYMCEAEYSDGTRKYHYTATENAARNWANRQFIKDDNVTVRIFDKEINLICTYHA